MQKIITQISSMAQNRKIPPLEQWNPTICGEMDLCIKANGEWWHHGERIQRQSLIDLFASVLWYEDGVYYLKTPIEKIKISVEDAPLHIQDVQQHDGKLYFISTQNDEIQLDQQHPIQMRFYHGQCKPYVYVRYGLWASLNRATFYRLVDLGTLYENEQGDTILKLISGDIEFLLTTCNQA